MKKKFILNKIISILLVTFLLIIPIGIINGHTDHYSETDEEDNNYSEKNELELEENHEHHNHAEKNELELSQEDNDFHDPKEENSFNYKLFVILFVIILTAFIFLFILNNTKNQSELVLRIIVFSIFLMHGITALTSKGFLSYFQIIGISESFAIFALPVIGLIDISVGLIILIKPIKAVLLWAVIWPLIPAIIGFFAFGSVLGFIGEIPSWGVPLALLYLMYLPKKSKELLNLKEGSLNV